PRLRRDRAGAGLASALETLSASREQPAIRTAPSSRPGHGVGSERAGASRAVPVVEPVLPAPGLAWRSREVRRPMARAIVLNAATRRAGSVRTRSDTAQVAAVRRQKRMATCAG